MNRKDFEIMAPVGSYESLYSAINAGADAIYFGVEGLNMRSRSSVNFTLEDLHEISRICDGHGVKSYLTVNTIIYDEDMDKCRAIIDAVANSGISAIIASDMAAILYARSRGVEVHISTQQSVSNIATLRFFAQYADVVVWIRSPPYIRRYLRKTYAGRVASWYALRCSAMVPCVWQFQENVISACMN